MKAYDEMKKAYMKGWKTWDNASVLSYVYMPDGVGIQLGLKDYHQKKLLKYALIGESEANGIVIPYAHTYDGSYIESRLIWHNNTLLIQAGTVDDDLVILVTPEKQPQKPSSLLIAGTVLWNRSGYVYKMEENEEEQIVLKSKEREIRIYTTAEHNGEVFAELTTPYLSVSLSEAIGISSGKKRTIEEIKTILADRRLQWEENKAKYGELAECYNAMQTCLAWDTIYNPQEDVPITTVSRIWNRDRGGYVLFCWDTYFGAIMEAIDEKELAYCNAIEMTKALTPAGFIPNYSSQDLTKSYDRSQPPVGSMVCLRIYEKYKETWFLEEVYENLVTWNQWFWDYRKTVNGLLTWGSDPYEVSPKIVVNKNGVNDRQGAAWESGLDNSPMYDGIIFDKERHQLLLDDVGLSGLYLQDCRSLAKIAEVLGDTEKAKSLNERAEILEERMEELWDESFGMYLNRRTDTGELQYRLTPFHFHALFSKKAGQARAERMIEEHMKNPEEFWGEYVLPSITRNDPAYPDNTYWRGRIWAPMNYLVYLALLEYDLPEVRRELAEKSRNLLMKEWLREGHVHENYNAENGEGCDVQNSDRYYHWGGLLALIALMESFS